MGGPHLPPERAPSSHLPQRKELRHEPEFTSTPLPALWGPHVFVFGQFL